MKRRIVIIAVGALVLMSCRKEKRTIKAAEEMQKFVIEISAYAKKIDPDFIIIPQNGEALCYQEANPDLALATAYIDAIDGIGVEEIFYNGDSMPDTYRLEMLRELVSYKKIMVSEYIETGSAISDAVELNLNEGFLCYARGFGNYDYQYINGQPLMENADNITEMDQVKNYLYLISNSQYTSKQSMIDAIAATNFDLVIIDLFFEEDVFTAAEIDQLKTKANGGHRLVIAYMSIGSAENYRYYWEDNWRLHKPNWLKKKYDGYKDEIWVKYWEPEWKNIIFGNDESYLKKIINAGFDGAYLDNVEAYYFLYHRK